MKGPYIGGVTAGERPSRKGVALRLWKYLYIFKWRIFLAILLTLAANGFALLIPLFSREVINAIALGKGSVDFQTVLFYCVLMAGFYLISAVSSYFLSLLMIDISQKTAVTLRRDVFGKLMSLPVSFFDNAQTGDLISRISYDVDTVSGSLAADLIQIGGNVITAVGAFVLMLIISPLLVLVFAVTIPISILTTRYISRKVRPLHKEHSTRLGAMNGYAEEMITGQRTIKAYRAEKHVLSRFEERNGTAAEAGYRADYYGCVAMPTVNLINNISISLVSLFGILLFILGGINIGGAVMFALNLGGVAAFTLYSRKFSGPINDVANTVTDLQSALAAAERVFGLIDEQPEKADKPGALTCVSVLGNVEMRNVDFSYMPGKPVLTDVSFEALPGKTVAIVGPTGGGKTTVISLLMRFYDPGAGAVYLDGRNVEDLTLRSLRGAYSMVLQDTWLFYGTVFENIAYAKPDATLEEVTAAAEAASIDGYIESLPEGYGSVLEEEGLNISKGQKQLIATARAMLSDAKMLILDEATSNVDTMTEVKIRRAMLRLMQGKTCFIIAHRLSTIVNSDVILVVKDGRIIERGTHGELLQGNTYYAELYGAQFE